MTEPPSRLLKRGGALLEEVRTIHEKDTKLPELRLLFGSVRVIRGSFMVFSSLLAILPESKSTAGHQVIWSQ